MRQDNIAYLAFLKVVDEAEPPCLRVDPDIFTPHEMDELTTRRAKAVCEECPIKIECLQFAYAIDDQHSVFGGFTPRERRALLRRRPAA